MKPKTIEGLNKRIIHADSIIADIVLAYAKADPDNGGGESIAWEDIDAVHELALAYLKANNKPLLEEQTEVARQANEWEPEA